MAEIIVSVWSLFMASCIWMLVCNNRCAYQVRELIRQVAAATEASGFKKSYWFVTGSVSYERHLWRLFTFRDPWAVYPPELAEVRKLAA